MVPRLMARPTKVPAKQQDTPQAALQIATDEASRLV